MAPGFAPYASLNRECPVRGFCLLLAPYPSLVPRAGLVLPLLKFSLALSKSSVEEHIAVELFGSNAWRDMGVFNFLGQNNLLL